LSTWTTPRPRSRPAEDRDAPFSAATGCDSVDALRIACGACGYRCAGDCPRGRNRSASPTDRGHVCQRPEASRGARGNDRRPLRRIRLSRRSERPPAAQRVAKTYSLREVANWPIKALRVHCVVFEVPDDRPIATVISVLAKDPDITLAQPLQQFHTLTDSSADSRYNDPLYDLQTNLASLGIPRAHERSQGDGVRIALIDTAVDTSHPDLHGRIAGSRSFLDEMARSSDGNRHGTAMAGLIAATANNRVGIVGVAPRAQVEVLEACWQLRPNADDAACNTFTLARALAAAIDAEIPLINLSIAGPADPLLSALIEAGLKRGAIFIGAASADADSFPANVPGVIGVGSVEHVVGHPTVTAPSIHVLTLRPRAQYDFVSGTSAATAEVTGVVALLLASDPHLSAGAIEKLLKRTAGS